MAYPILLYLLARVAFIPVPLVGIKGGRRIRRRRRKLLRKKKKSREEEEEIVIFIYQSTINQDKGACPETLSYILFASEHFLFLTYCLWYCICVMYVYFIRAIICMQMELDRLLQRHIHFTMYYAKYMWISNARSYMYSVFLYCCPKLLFPAWRQIKGKPNMGFTPLHVDHIGLLRARK